MFWLVLFITLFVYPESYCESQNTLASLYERLPPLFSLEPYEPCVRAGGVYCVGKVHLAPGNNTELYQYIKNYSQLETKRFNHTYSEQGSCVTKSCAKFIKNKDVNNDNEVIKAFNQCVNEELNVKYGLKGNLADTYCERGDKTTSLDAGDWSVAIILMAIVAINIIATIYDVVFNENNKHGNKYLLCFSMKRNWMRLTTSENNDLTKHLKCIHGIRVLISFLSITVHILFIKSVFIDNPLAYEAYYDKMLFHMFINGSTLVQFFFVISGLLLVYQMRIKTENQIVTWTMLPKLLLFRCLRVLPVSTGVVAFNATLLRHLGSGPLWRHQALNMMSQDCRTYWLSHLLQYNNYESRNSSCNLPSWAVAVDIQLFVLGSIIFFATVSRGRKLAMALLLVLGVILPAFEIWWNNYPALVLASPESFRIAKNEMFWSMHIRGHNNLAGYGLGMIGGHFLYNRLNEENKNSNSKIFSYMCILGLPLNTLIFISGQYFYESNASSILIYKLIYAGWLRLIQSLIMVCCLISLILNAKNWFSRVCAWDGWVVPSKLSFAVNMTHMSILYYISGTRTQLMHVSTFNLVLMLFGVTWMSFLVALPVHLLVEAPINRLLNISTVNKEKGKEKKIN